MGFKKKLLAAVLATAMLVASPCMAEQVAYEPEDGGGASFSTHDFIKNRIISSNFAGAEHP